MEDKGAEQCLTEHLCSLINKWIVNVQIAVGGVQTIRFQKSLKVDFRVGIQT